MNFENDKGMYNAFINSDARMEQILDTLKNKDKDTLKTMFSKKALSEADDFEGQIEYLYVALSWLR